MNQLYRFSPIKNKKDLLEAIEYITTNATKLGEMVLNEQHYIGSLTVFSHYKDEFERLKEILLDMGNLETENNGPFVRFSTPLRIGRNNIQLVRIRKPDPYRMQVGCVDFIIEDYNAFKKKYLKSKSDNLRLFERLQYEMIEFFDPDFDVLAYVLSENLFL